MFQTINTNDKMIFSIDGNIGSGKSTLFEELKVKFNTRSDIKFIEEPVDEWAEIKDETGKTMLENYCSDHKKYAFSFQIMACVTRMKKLLDALQEPNIKFIISERSILTDKNVFAKMLFDSENISKMDYDIYKVFYDTHSSFIHIIIMVYIRTKPEICQQRVIKRNRKGEDMIPLEYLEMCHNYHESWIMDSNINHKMIIDGNKSHDENPEQMTTWINEFECFIKFYEDHVYNKKQNTYFTKQKDNATEIVENVVTI